MQGQIDHFFSIATSFGMGMQYWNGNVVIWNGRVLCENCFTTALDRIFREITPNTSEFAGINSLYAEEILASASSSARWLSVGNVRSMGHTFWTISILRGI